MHGTSLAAHTTQCAVAKHNT